MAEIVLEDVWKVYPDGTEAVRSLDLDIGDKEFVVLVGPSGCGKTTALRMIAGLEQISRGTVSIGDRVVNDVPPKGRDIAMVFQNYALYPHMSVYDNMAFGLKLQKVPKHDIEGRVREAARILGLDELLARKPAALSGGQRQRVAMGRAIVRNPQAFLMDEPLSNLDAKLRVQMRSEIARIQSELGVTTIYVTHDQTEAMTMADRIVVLKDGLVQQIDSPQMMYDHPNNVFVAGFIGSPAMNFIRARLEKENGAYAVTFGKTRLRLTREEIGEAKERGHEPEQYTGKEVVLGIRPEHMEDAETEEAQAMEATGNTSSMDVEPQVIESMGSEKYVYFGVPREQEVHLESIEEMTSDTDGGDGASSAEDSSGELMVARVSAQSTARLGDKMRLIIDSSKIHLFDPETEEAIF